VRAGRREIEERQAPPERQVSLEQQIGRLGPFGKRHALLGEFAGHADIRANEVKEHQPPHDHGQ
jgi:hypothetical protein